MSWIQRSRQRPCECCSRQKNKPCKRDNRHTGHGSILPGYRDRRHGAKCVVVRGIDERVFGQLEQSVEDGIILLPRIAVLEIGAAGAADEQRIPVKTRSAMV